MATIKIKKIGMTTQEFADESDNHSGYCVACGEVTSDCCEPDARRYECPVCEKKTVFGMDESLLNGFIDITG